MNVRKITVILVYLAYVVVGLVMAAKESNKRIPGSTHAFQQMVRYGRSSDKDGKIRVYPRADVFYLGPRYGKRSNMESINNALNEDKSIPCIYTGITNLYRCNIPRRPALDNNLQD
ncbi:RYamide neuropeptides-like [Anthonomus grandis grandis]|uniref:RYamide neuropeptides-like n=1 Tax=Anthonomus grandis grandis TaxID=2921223 RepID=UPI0021668FD3|nr:RYamide neuropeptides-like [Anthonomus grandis grandis]